ncbi:MAG: glycosyltransferase family 4 protein [Fibrobacter sp.]|nr:glycosyltransferase family 4 protein [Fibrobacter sp.]
MIHIVTPSEPVYREHLFNKLHSELKCNFYSGNRFDGTKVVKPKLSRKEYNSLSFAKVFLWQKGLSQIKLNKKDVLVIVGNIKYLSNIPLVLRAKLKGVKIVWWGQVWSAGTTMPKMFLRVAFARLVSNHFLTYTDKEIEKVPKWLYPRRRMFATNNAMNDIAVNEAKKNWGAERLNKFKVEKSLENKKVVLFCGRLTNKVDMPFALRVIKQISTVEPRILFVVVGDGPNLEELKQQSKELNLESNITWIGSIYDENYLAPWFLSSDVLFYPGAIGLSLTHAFHYQLPVLTHDKIENHMPEIAALEVGKNGEVYKKDNLNSAAEVLSNMLADKEKLQKMGEHGQAMVKAKYSMESMVENFIKAVTF